MANAAKYFLGLWIAGVVAATFLWLPPAQGFQSEGLARILAFHLPNALVVIVAAIAAGVYAFRYLAGNRDLLNDARSTVSATLALIFCVITTVTGMVFAQVQWGAPWNWDPKQTCIFVLLLIYAAYFVLRAGIEDPDKRASVAAVYMLFAALMTPVLGYIVPRYLPTLHPTNAKLDYHYHAVVWSGVAGLLGLYAWLQNIAVRYERVRLRIEAREAEGG